VYEILIRDIFAGKRHVFCGIGRAYAIDKRV